MSITTHRGRRATPAEARPRWWKRWLLAPIILLVCAVVPWLIPWPWQNPSPSSAGPADTSAPVVVKTASPGASASQDESPTDESVERIGKKISGQKESYDLPVDRTEVRGVSTKPGAYAKLGRIAIPRVGLDVTFGEGVFAETLARGPGHWPGTPSPGRAGNAVISGHRNTNTQPFKRIDELKPGDKIIVTLQGHSSTTYAVENTTIVPEAEYREFVLRQPASAKARQLTIFACHPEGNPIYRIVVRATATT